jgi:hypothetical protein
MEGAGHDEGRTEAGFLVGLGHDDYLLFVFPLQ